LLVWVAIVLVVFVGPLTVFGPALLRHKRRALLEYSTFACNHNRAFERKWVQRGAADQDVLGTPDISSWADLTTGVQTIGAMRVIPVGAGALKPLLIATGLPWVAVLATKVLLKELLMTVAKSLL
jgi:hypothetical protein